MELNRKIKWLKTNNWSDDLIKQQLYVDYNINYEKELIEHIKLKVRNIDPIKILLGAGTVVGITNIIMKHFKL